VATKEDTNITVPSHDDARFAQAPVTCTPLMAAYGVPTTDIDSQTTSVQDHMDKSTINTKDDGSFTLFGRTSSLPAHVVVVAMGVAYVNPCHVVPLTPPDNLPDFDAALWHEFALEVAQIHLGAKQVSRCGKLGLLGYALVTLAGCLELVPFPVFVSAIVLLPPLMFFLALRTTPNLHEAGQETVIKFAPKFLSKGYKIVCDPETLIFQISCIRLISRIENELVRHSRSQQVNAEVELLQDGNAIILPAVGVALIKFQEIDSQRLPDNLPDLDARLWHDFALRIAHIYSRAHLALRCVMAIGMLSMVIFTCSSALLFMPIVMRFLELSGAASIFCLTVIFVVFYVREKSYGSTVKEFTPKLCSQGYILVYFWGRDVIMLLSKDNSS
jgi:hypothetical protein